MIREALFSRWQGRLAGARLLDLFAGSGAVGLEAVSRGAAEAVCVEGRRAVERELARAVQRLSVGNVAVRLARLPSEAGKIQPDGGFDLVFADPPYDFTRWEALLSVVADWLADRAEVALEHSVRVELPQEVGGLVRSSARRYGESCLSFYSAEPVGTSTR
jgi:16S rRNA (guanine966-N2)-methyltransferase